MYLPRSGIVLLTALYFDEGLWFPFCTVGPLLMYFQIQMDSVKVEHVFLWLASWDGEFELSIVVYVLVIVYFI